MQTYGEQLIQGLLSRLSTKEFFYFVEPTIVTNGESSRHNPDFVVVSALMGVIVLEVKDYVCIKEFRQKELKIERRDGTLETVQNPINIAKDYALNLAKRFQERRELLEKGGRHKGKLKFPWLCAAVLPHIERHIVQQAEQQGIWEQGSALCQQDLTSENFEKALRRIPGPWKLERPLNLAILDVIRGVLDPVLIVRDSQGQDVGTLTGVQEYEVKRPIIVVDSSKPQILNLGKRELPLDAEHLVEDFSVRLVRGVAGSGKSLVLARRAQYLAEHKPEMRILVLTYNVDLAQSLRQKISACPNIDVTNFHKICSRVMGKKWKSPSSEDLWLHSPISDLFSSLDLPVEFVNDEIAWRKDLELFDNEAYLGVERSGRGKALPKTKREIFNQIFDQYLRYQHQTGLVDWADVPFETFKELQPGHQLWHHFDAILIDEAQDFAPSWMKVVKVLLKPKGSLFLCDDPAQSIFRFSSWKQKGIDVAGHTRKLQVPFRSTVEITGAAHCVFSADPLLSQLDEVIQPDLKSYELPHGDKPLLIEFHSSAQEVCSIEQKVVSLIQSGLDPKSIAVLCHDKRFIGDWKRLERHGIYVESFWKMKGLEFEVVFLPHFQTVFEQPDKTSDEQTVSAIRRRVFTAMTRARQTLTISYCGTFPTELASLEPYMQKTLNDIAAVPELSR